MEQNSWPRPSNLPGRLYEYHNIWHLQPTNTGHPGTIVSPGPHQKRIVHTDASSSGEQPFSSRLSILGGIERAGKPLSLSHSRFITIAANHQNLSLTAHWCHFPFSPFSPLPNPGYKVYEEVKTTILNWPLVQRPLSKSFNFTASPL